MTGGKDTEDSRTPGSGQGHVPPAIDYSMIPQDHEFFGRLPTGLAHDLRNLLVPITTCLQMISASPSGARELAPLALRNLESLQEFVRQARWYSEHRVPQWQMASLGPLLDRTVGLMEDRLRAKSLRPVILVPDEVVAEVDSVLLMRLMVNLLINAIDAAPTGSIIRLELTLPKEGACQFTVSDQGAGIPSAKLERFFAVGAGEQPTPAGQAEPGMGWAICRRIARLHGGDIQLLSPPGGGTCVLVELPLRQQKMV